MSIKRLGIHKRMGAGVHGGQFAYSGFNKTKVKKIL